MARLTHPPSLWAATAVAPINWPELEGAIKADVAIVGAGYCGLSAAIHLAEGGLRVAVIEAAEPGWGASGRNGGQVVPGFRIDPDETVQHSASQEIGERLVAAAGAGPDLVFDMIERHSITCDSIRNGWMQAAAGNRGQKLVQSRVEQWLRRGAPVSHVPADDFKRMTGAHGYRDGWLDKRGGQLNPLSYARGLAAAAKRLGAQIYANSKVQKIEKRGAHWHVASAKGSVEAGKLLICTNGYTDNIWPRLRQTVIPVTAAAVATSPLPPLLLATVLPAKTTVADTRRLICWFGLDRTGRLYFGGRGGPVRKDPRSQTRDLEARLRSVFPQLNDLAIEYRWSGQVALTLDHLPHIHEPEPNVLMGLGFNGRGVAMATVVGRVLAARILGDAKHDLPFPNVPIRPIPFHGLRHLGLATAVQIKKIQDRVDS